MNNAVIKNSLTLNHNSMMTECKVFVVHKTIINLSSGKYWWIQIIGFVQQCIWFLSQNWK